MRRAPHGSVLGITDFKDARDAVAHGAAGTRLGFAAAARRVVTEDFGFLLPELQDDPENLLPVESDTRDNLVALGQAMEAGDAGGGSSGIPAAYTYFGQFVDHDITLDLVSATLPDLFAEDLGPLPLSEVEDGLQNGRMATLELDSVYGDPAPRDPQDDKKMKVGKTSATGDRPEGKGPFNDLPRASGSEVPKEDRAAQIGDPRNDENLIVAQMHVAFLRAHNELVERGARFQEAQRRLRRHYQHVVLHDFLKRIVDPRIVDDIIANGNKVYDPEAAHLFMPLEFSVAAYRFGHSMVRTNYNFNVNFPGATLDLLFGFTAESGQLGGAEALPDNWIIQWENLVDGEGPFDRANRIDTNLVNLLAQLKNVRGETLRGDRARLAVRNLLRGYLLRMPTGQAVARALRRRLAGVREIPVLRPAEIKAAARSDKQVQVLKDSKFDNRTPLWFYILAEASALGGGRRLGPVGGTIVAEVLVGLVRRSEGSILNVPDWEPSLPSDEPGEFTLNDLLRFAGVLD